MGEPAWFHHIEQFARAVMFASSLPALAESTVVYARDDEEGLILSEPVSGVKFEFEFVTAQRTVRRMRQKQLWRANLEENPQEVRRLAAELCMLHGYVRSIDAMGDDVLEGGQEPPLVEKAIDGLASAVQLLVQANADLELTDACKRTALHGAAQAGHVEVACMLMTAGADLEAADQFGGTPLRLACSNGNLGVVQTLLDARANLEATALWCVFRCWAERVGMSDYNRPVHQSSTVLPLVLDAAGEDIKWAE